jgi:hypothetical protein
MRARRKNGKPQLRNALLKMFWRSCVVDGLLVFIFSLAKALIPVFLAQLLFRFQGPIAIDGIPAAAENNETTTLSTSIVEFTAASTIISNTNDGDDDNILEKFSQYIMFIW